MKKLLMIITFVIITSALKAQTNTTVNDTTIYSIDDIKSQANEKDASAGSFQYRVSRINYPVNAIRNDIQGTVELTFVIEKDGSLSNIHVTKKVSPDLDNESVRALKASPKWKAFVLNGNPVRVRYIVPVKFSMD